MKVAERARIARLKEGQRAFLARDRDCAKMTYDRRLQELMRAVE
jgi:predicted mannosyl-3-phosphoglycerate phosphatase (HAD superfamily)